MSQIVEEHFAFKLPDNVPLYQNENEYVQVRESCLIDYHESASRDLRESFIEASAYITANPSPSLYPGVVDGDGEKRLELAIRFQLASSPSSHMSYCHPEVIVDNRCMSGCGRDAPDIKRAHWTFWTPSSTLTTKIRQTSDVRAWLGFQAPALAWLPGALA
ncbi:hypothetical protein DFH07DRAFT_969647 [Mycena maculata]|uniref:Uncharacterized protein n=1 Tax=Mycena maculata TaxID=230809 RepID=A0AAD7MRT1_9AGAR|nr:hypothetical protein DFH07DRAFT_969647 [Mycena maculata]